MTKKEKITIKAKEILDKSPGGVRFSELVNSLREFFPGEAYGNFTGAIWNLDTRFPDEIYKPSRGIFRLVEFKADESVPTAPDVSNKNLGQIREDMFYQPFADWIVLDLGECTRAIPLGGNRFREKWGTPDILGIFKSRDSDIVKIPLEVVVAEVKIDATELITAFGQACAYKLFAHKSYLVIPQDARKEDIERLDALCIICGIGLILFDATKPDFPDFQIRVRADRHDPDPFYINSYIKQIADELHL